MFLKQTIITSRNLYKCKRGCLHLLLLCCWYIFIYLFTIIYGSICCCIYCVVVVFIVCIYLLIFFMPLCGVISLNVNIMSEILYHIIDHHKKCLNIDSFEIIFDYFWTVFNCSRVYLHKNGFSHRMILMASCYRDDEKLRGQEMSLTIKPYSLDLCGMW